MGEGGVAPNGLEGRSRARCCTSAPCIVVLAGCSVLSLLLGVWSRHLYQRFTPVYTDIVCHQKAIRLGDGANLVQDLQHRQIQFHLSTECQNPNPYSVVLRSTGEGQVYAGSGRVLVATITDVPEATLEAQGAGSLNATVRLGWGDTLGSSSGLVQGVSLLLGQEVPIFIRNEVEVIVDVSLLFGHLSLTRQFSRDCGMKVKLWSAQSRGPALGGMVCAESFDDLPPLPRPLPHAGGRSPESEIRLSARGVAEEQIEEGERAKNVGLGSATAVSFGGSFCLLCTALVADFRRRQGLRNIAEKGSAPPPSGVGEPSAQAGAPNLMQGAQTFGRADKSLQFEESNL